MAFNLALGCARAAALVIARCAHRAIRNSEGIAQGIGNARVANPHRPWPPVPVAPADIDIPSSIDREIFVGAEFVRSHINCQPLGNGAEIKQQRTKQRDCLAIRIEAHISIRCGAAALGGNSHRPPAAILAVEAAHLHGRADRRIERSASLLGDR
jgi:hypothetical protein